MIPRKVLLVVSFVALLFAVGACMALVSPTFAERPSVLPVTGNPVTNAKFAEDARTLAKMLNAVADQAEHSEGRPVQYVTEAYPHMVHQMGVVLKDLGEVKLVEPGA